MDESNGEMIDEIWKIYYKNIYENIDEIKKTKLNNIFDNNQLYSNIVSTIPDIEEDAIKSHILALNVFMINYISKME